MESFWGYDWSLTCLPVLFQKRSRRGLSLKWPSSIKPVRIPWELHSLSSGVPQHEHRWYKAEIPVHIMLTCWILHGNITQLLTISRNGIIRYKILLAVGRRIFPSSFVGCVGVLQLPKETVWNWLAHAKTLFFKNYFSLRRFCIHKAFLQDCIFG